MVITDPEILKDLEILRKIYKEQKRIVKDIPEPTDDFMMKMLGKMIKKFLHRKVSQMEAMKTPSGARGMLYAAQYQRCYYCKKHIAPPSETTLDHKTPLFLGGMSTIDNLCVSCATCNSEKGSMTEAEYISFRVKKYGVNHFAIGELQVSSLSKAVEENMAHGL